MPTTPLRDTAATPVRRVLFGALGAAALLGGFLALAQRAPVTSGQAATSAPDGLSLVARTPQHLQHPANITPLVKRLAARDVRRVWVQVKQDETDEFTAGTAFYPSHIAPVAPGYGDDRLGTFIDALDRRDIAPIAWMPTLLDTQAAAAHPEWRSYRIADNGRVVRDKNWLCPFAPGVAEYQASIAREVVGRYPKLRGLYLDFIRYDNDYSCASPEALAQLDVRTKWRQRTGRALTPMDIRHAGEAGDDLWTAWTDLRAEKIVDVVNTVRDAVDEVRPDFFIGAFVLPFSSEDYSLNTQAGQDLERMARAGLDEITLMAYWDDWDKSPAWAGKSLDAAAELLDGEADLGVVLDGDMGVRRTRLTLEAIGPWASKASWFNYSAWSEGEFRRLTRAIEGHRKGPMPRPDHVSVVVRVDTEPDSQASYASVRPEMIDSLIAMFGEEGIHGTFITVGKLAELQTAAMRRAADAGHEIGSHSYNHEQIDSLPVSAQLETVDRGLDALDTLGFDAVGFGAPRNSISDQARDRLMDWNLEYDGSAAYDPLRSMLDVHYAPRSDGGDSRIVVVPFIEPNDWDARYADSLSAAEMLEAWTTRLDAVVASGEPVFVLDVHQWIAAHPENLAAVRDFIRYAKRCDGCRVETLRQAAQNARAVLDRYELPATTSGDSTREMDR